MLAVELVTEAEHCRSSMPLPIATDIPDLFVVIGVQVQHGSCLLA